MTRETEGGCQLEAVLCCPQCKGHLIFGLDQCDCQSCSRTYPIVNGKYYFRPVNPEHETQDLSGRFKLIGQRFPGLYSFLIALLSPVLTSGLHKQVLNQVDGCIVNIGSGTRSIGDGVINVDLVDYPNVSVIADIEELPFQDGSLDAVFSIAALEHTREPRHVVKECYRALRDGGFIFSVIAFMQPVHGSPSDYQRYTRAGIEHLHREFKTIESGVYGGPVSGFLWVFQEFVSLLLSFGIGPIRELLAMILMVLTWPVKLLDFFFRGAPTAESIASTFYYHGRKDIQPELEEQATASQELSERPCTGSRSIDQPS